jgi:hypothetical protein
VSECVDEFRVAVIQSVLDDWSKKGFYPPTSYRTAVSANEEMSFPMAYDKYVDSVEYIISCIFFPLIRTGLKNPYGHANSLTCVRSLEVVNILKGAIVE